MLAASGDMVLGLQILYAVPEKSSQLSADLIANVSMVWQLPLDLQSLVPKLETIGHRYCLIDRFRMVIA